MSLATEVLPQGTVFVPLTAHAADGLLREPVQQ